MIKGKILRAMVDTGSSINLMTENFGDNKEQIEKLKVFTINGSMEINKSITLDPSKICPSKQKFYLHKFSNSYDILIGRDYLRDSKAKIDYEKETVTLGNTLLYIRYGENDIVKDKIEEDKTASECLNPPLSKDQSFNFAINNELKECNEYRLEHLNEEEKENLKRVLFEYNDIQYKEGENLTFTSTIRHSIQTKHEDPIYRKPYKYPQTFDEEVNKQINEMIEQGIVRKSKSPYCSPIWIVPKKSDASGKPKFRLV